MCEHMDHMGWFCFLWRPPNSRKKLNFTGGFWKNSKFRFSKPFFKICIWISLFWISDCIINKASQLSETGWPNCRAFVFQSKNCKFEPSCCSFFPIFLHCKVFFGYWGCYRPLGVQVSPKIGIFTAPCGSHETSIIKFCTKIFIGSL